jgi:hypothetical protein
MGKYISNKGTVPWVVAWGVARGRCALSYKHWRLLYNNLPCDRKLGRRFRKGYQCGAWNGRLEWQLSGRTVLGDGSHYSSG